MTTNLTPQSHSHQHQPPHPAQFAIEWWKNRHDIGYFPMMKQHLNWKVYEAMPQWFIEAANPTPNDIALEVGCGYGAWMVPMSRLVKSVNGVDIHQSLVDKAYEKFEEHSVDNAHVVLGDGLSLPYPDSTYDLVYSMAVFYHIPRILTCTYLKETTRVLRPGGRCLHTFLSADQEGTVQDIKAGQTGEWSVGWTVDQVRTAALEAGLADVKVSSHGMLLLVATKPKERA